MKPIWFFVGLLLLILGTLVLISAVMAFVSPPSQQKVLAGLHPEFWWGLVMVCSGGVFLFLNRKRTVG
jgi:hypothetical protein